MTRLSRVLLSACVVYGLAAAAQAQERRQVPEYRVLGAPASEGDAAAIDDLMERFKRAWSEQRTEELLETHAPDVEWINAYARIFRGTEALGAFLDDKLFPEFDPAVSKREVRNMKPISRRYVGSDAAVLHWYTDGDRGASRNDGEQARRTHLHFVLGKEDGEWRIVHLAIFDARS